MMTVARDISGCRLMLPLVPLVMLGTSIVYGQATKQGEPPVDAGGIPAATAPPEEGEREDPGAALEGLWPSRELMRLFLVRMVDRVAGRYELDKEQSRSLQEATVERWTRFAAEHRRELQPLLNEFLEMRMGTEPPSKERVKAWAERLEPVFAQYRAEFDTAVDEFREMLGPKQRAKFEVDALKHRTGLEFAESKIRRWKEGKFLPRDLWDRPGERDDETGELQPRVKAAEQDAAGGAGKAEQPVDFAGPVDQIALELLRWEAYVARFNRLYSLDEGQRDAVRSCLLELERRAMAHRNRYWDEIVALEQRIGQQPASGSALATIEEQLVKLYGPVDEMFQELKERISRIPTEAQRAVAETREEVDAEDE